jgi:hypothetical protein
MQNFLVLVSLTRDPVHSFATATIYIWIFSEFNEKQKDLCTSKHLFLVLHMAGVKPQHGIATRGPSILWLYSSAIAAS